MTSRPRGLAGAALVAVALTVWPVLAQPAKAPVVTPQERRWQADRLFDQGRYDEARDAYLALLGDFARDAEFNRDLGWAFYRARQPDFARAIHHWTQSWELDGKEDLKIEAARAYARIGQWQRGSKLLLDLAAAHPQHPEHWREAAELAEVAKDLTQAEAWYRTYLARRPADVSARIALARIYGGTKRFPEAVTEFEAALRVSPRSTPARLGIAQVLAWRGSLDESIRRYDELLREQPANVDAQRGKAFALLWAGRWQEAGPLFQGVARRRPNDREVRSALAEVARLERVAAEAGGAAAPPAADPLTARIDEAFARGDGDAAVALLNEALARSPGDRRLRRRLAQAHLLADRIGPATEILAALRAEPPDDPEVLRELASALLRGAQLPEAIDTLFAYLALRPDDRGARVDVARVLSWTRRFDEATREYQRVLDADPANVEGRVGLAQVEAWQGHYAEALGKFDAILATHPAQREALIGRAQATFWTGRRPEALELMARVQQQFPEDREIAKLRADLEEADRQQTLAAMDTVASIRYHEALLAKTPDDNGLLRTLGDLHARQGDYARAVDYYRRVVAAQPTDTDAQLALARSLGGLKAHAEAASVLRTLIEAEPLPARRLELAQALASARDYEQSASVYRQLVEERPDDLDARLGLARVLSWDRQYDGSIAAYREVIERWPDRRDARVEHARVHAWKGDLETAVRLFTALEAQYPDDRDVLLGKGQSLQWSGRPRDAQRVLEPLLAAHPDDRDVRVAVASNQLALGRSDLALRQLELASAGAPGDADVQLLRSLALRQVRPVLVVTFSPSSDSDDLDIYPGAATLYFSAIPRLRSYVRGLLTPSTIPSRERARGREAVFGSTIQLTPGVIARGEAGANVGYQDETSVIGGGGVTLSPSGRVRIDLDARRQFLNYLPLAYERDISRVLMSASADFRPGAHVTLHADYFHGRYSDDNRLDGGNLVVSRAFVRGRALTLEAGYLYSLSGFANDPGNGYYAPSRLERHAGVVNAYGRASSWFGYTLAGTAGAEEASDADEGYRPDGSIRFSLDFTLGERLRLSAGYGYSRVASLVRAGAYASHSLTAGVEVGF